MYLKTVAYKRRLSGNYRPRYLKENKESWLLQTLQTAEKLKVNTPLS